MKFPKLTELNTSRSMIDVFGGYNHNLRIGEGEFYDMQNLTSNNYPVLSPRPKRGTYASDITKQPQGLTVKDSLCFVDNGVLYINEQPIRHTNMVLDTKSDKTLISMGAYLIIMPDKIYINTADHNDCGRIEHTFVTTDGDDVTYEPCMLDGEYYKDDQDHEIDTSNISSATEPTNPKNLQLWVDVSVQPNVLKQYSESKEEWVSIATTYIKISYPNIGLSFKEGDGVKISGLGNSTSALADLNDKISVIQARGQNYIVVIGLPCSTTTSRAQLTVQRRMPKLDFVVESENRLWGCRYGTDVNGNVVNEIYASKLGDFKNWNCFQGISTDSYVASVGTDGQFTGATTHLGYPIFFKENCMHKVYGNYPANFQIQTTTCRGVQKGCHKSLATVNEVLYYKSRSAVCAYDGSLPVEISSALGDESYSDAVAGAIGNKYYISMIDSIGAYHLFVYDAKRGMWHKEDDTYARDFCACRGDLYYIDNKSNTIMTVLGSGTKESGRIKWKAETGIIGTDSPDKKYISRIDVRMSVELGTDVYFYIQYDSSGAWEHVYTATGLTLRNFSVPIRSKRCDHLKLRIEGAGDAKIYSICKTIEQGSNI